MSKYTQKCNIFYIKKNQQLCNTLNWGNWNKGFVKLAVPWAERDIWIENWWIGEMWFGDSFWPDFQGKFN